MFTPNIVNRPTAAVFRGRLHIAARQGTNEIWYMSCGGACASQSADWTRWVQQDGVTDNANFLDAFGANDGYLYLCITWRPSEP